MPQKTTSPANTEASRSSFDSSEDKMREICCCCGQMHVATGTAANGSIRAPLRARQQTHAAHKTGWCRRGSSAPSMDSCEKKMLCCSHQGWQHSSSINMTRSMPIVLAASITWPHAISSCEYSLYTCPYNLHDRHVCP